MDVDNKMAKDKTTEEQLARYRTKHKSLMFGAFSIISMFIAIIFYENIFTIGQTLVTYEGARVNESFLIAAGFAVMSVLFSLIGVIYSLKNKKIVGFLLSIIVLVGIGFTCKKTDHLSPSELISKIAIVK